MNGAAVVTAVAEISTCVVLNFAQTNTKIELFKLDDTLPPEMFAQLCRVSAVSGRLMGDWRLVGS